MFFLFCTGHGIFSQLLIHFKDFIPSVKFPIAQSSGFENTIELPGAVGFIPHFGAAEPAAILVPVSIRQDQEQELSDRHGAAALGAIKFGGLQVLKIGLRLIGRFLIGRDKMERIVFHGWNLWMLIGRYDTQQRDCSFLSGETAFHKIAK
jgi:hypothetical protein